MKDISTLIPDIQGLFHDGAILTPAAVECFAKAVGNNISERFKSYTEERKPRLRMSNIGKPLRQLWFELHAGIPPEALSPDTKLKFMYGDLIEDFLILLAIEAGHEVARLQEQVELDGVPGSIDCFIDGILVDIKSASTFSFNKFKSGELHENDPFGYIGQLAGYSSALGCASAAFLVVDKTLGHLCLMTLSEEEIKAYDARARIRLVKEVLASDEMPPCCCAPIPDGKSGNEKLPVQGAYCGWKCHCYPELRTFLYSSGPVFLTKVERVPNVLEVTKEEVNSHG